MRVELAKNAGFCFGVNRAVNKVYEEIEKGSSVYTYGPIIHNEEVIADLEKKGVQVVESPAQLQDKSDATVIIRSHGVPKSTFDELHGTGARVEDATCPYVKKIHRLVTEASENGNWVIVIGSAKHPEVQGIVGWSDPERTFVVDSEEEIAALPDFGDQEVCVVAQTTYNFKKFYDLVEIIQKKEYIRYGSVAKVNKVIVNNTICSATKERQESAKELSARVDAMIVIGGLSSSNTKKLYEICSENCLNTYFIQTKEDLVDTDFSRFDYVGITAGASTPKIIIEEVQKYVRDEL